MEIVVCVKRVAATDSAIKVAADGRSIDPAGVEFELNAYDEFAVEVRVLASRPWVCVFPPDHPDSGQHCIEATRLAEMPLVGFSPGMSLRARVDQEFAAAAVEPRFTAAGQTVETLCALVAAGVAGAVIHPYAGHVAAMHGLATTEIVGLTPLDLVLVTSATRRPSQLAEEFVTAMEAVFA